MNYTKEQLIDAIVNEWEYLCHDCPEPDDATPEERRAELETMTIEQLVDETDTDEEYMTLDQYMEIDG